MALLVPGLAYRSATLYALVIRALYGPHAVSRAHSIATRIARGARVVDLCCGPPVLYRTYLRAKDVDYLGIDINEGFLRKVERSGGRALRCDLRTLGPLPRGDFVVMQGSLYHFLPDPAPLVWRMLEAATREVIIAEPVRNVTGARWRGLSLLAARLTDPGYGAQRSRFTEATLKAHLAPFAGRILETVAIAGGREILYALRGAGVVASASATGAGNSNV